MNSYIYVNNNPLNWVGPTGEDWLSVGLSAVSFAAGVAGTAALISGAPVLGIGVVGWGTISLAASAYGAYRSWNDYRSGRIHGAEFGMSLGLSAASNIPYAGFAWGIGSVGWETGQTFLHAKAPRTRKRACKQ